MLELIARELRAGEPVACAYGCQVTPDGLRAGLLFARAGLTGPLEFIDPQTQNTYLLTLPPDYLNLDEDGWGEQELLRSP